MHSCRLSEKAQCFPACWNRRDEHNTDRRRRRRCLGSPDGFAQATQLTSVFPIRLWLAVLVPTGRPPETRALQTTS